jgi:hypothetical protein
MRREEKVDGMCPFTAKTVAADCWIGLRPSQGM